MGISPSTQAEQTHALEPVATTEYTGVVVEALRTTPAPGMKELIVGAKLTVTSESWHEGKAGPWSAAPSVMPCYECPYCHQPKRKGNWTTLQWEASSAEDKPFTLDIRVPGYICEECQIQYIDGGEFDATADDVTQFHQLIADLLVQGKASPVGQETVPELTVETMVSREFLACLGTKAAMNNLSEENLDLLLVKITDVVKKTNSQHEGKTPVRLHRVKNEEIEKLREIHGLYNHKSATMLRLRLRRGRPCSRNTTFQTAKTGRESICWSVHYVGRSRNGIA